MTIQLVSLGTPPGAVDGDSARAAFEKINQNFSLAEHAASRLVMASPTDSTTPNALMPRGAFGIGISERGNLTITSGVFYAPQDIRAIIGNANGHYTISSPTGGSFDFGSTTLVPERYGVIKGFSDDGNGYSYSWQIYTSVTGKQYRRRGLTATSWSAWGLIYDQSNILGAVSQLAGVPTGAIIERGSNANGSYVKFADGTLICTHTLASSTSSDVGWGYPSQFSALSCVNVCPLSSNNFLMAGKFNGVTLSYADFSIYGSNNTRLGSAINQLFALGRWY